MTSVLTSVLEKRGQFGLVFRLLPSLSLRQGCRSGTGTEKLTVVGVSIRIFASKLTSLGLNEKGHIRKSTWCFLIKYQRPLSDYLYFLCMFLIIKPL